MNSKKVLFNKELETIHIDDIPQHVPMEIVSNGEIIGHAAYDGEYCHAITELGVWTGRANFNIIKKGIDDKITGECEFFLLNGEF